MEINREIIQKLCDWKQKQDRKPLIIQGARQIGKTWVMLKFGELEYEHVAYFNFDASEELCREFDNTKDPNRLLGILQLYSTQPIVPHKTLIIFDEIQQCNRALNCLKYFCENTPEYHIVAAGSLLGVSLSRGDSFPVGKVEFLRMYPISFREFIRCDDAETWNYLNNIDGLEALPEIVYNRALESFRRYEVCGGMPAAVIAMLERKGTGDVEDIQQGILTSYSLDFAKHASKNDIPRISAIWKSIPSQLARENRKFVYKLVKDGARGREYEDSLLWLEQAGIIHRVFCTSKPGLPITAYDDMSAFKIYLSDVGLLRRLASLPASVFWEDSELFSEFKGALTENVILQSLVSQYDTAPRYWTSSGVAEVDFIQQDGLNLLPIEVKSGRNISGKSMSVYIKKYAPILAIRFSLQNLSLKDNVLNVPLFMGDWVRQLVRLATN